MLIKRMLLLAGMALAAMAFAVPAVASASGGAIQDTQSGNTAQQGREITVTGTNLAFISELGGFAGCDIHADVVVDNAAANTGHVINAAIAPDCTGVGLLEGCEVEEIEQEGAWHVTVTPHDLDLEDVTIIGTNGGPECAEAFHHIDLNIGGLTLTPEAGSNTSLDNLTIDDLGSSSATFTDLGGLETGIVTSGEIHATGSDAGTWQIETTP